MRIQGVIHWRSCKRLPLKRRHPCGQMSGSGRTQGKKVHGGLWAAGVEGGGKNRRQEKKRNGGMKNRIEEKKCQLKHQAKKRRTEVRLAEGPKKIGRKVRKHSGLAGSGIPPQEGTQNTPPIAIEAMLNANTKKK